jgi:hypothetical protein
MDDLRDLFEERFGKPKPVEYQVIFCIPDYGESVIIKAEGLDWLIKDSVGTNLLSDILDANEIKTISILEPGIYKSKFTVNSFRSNHPQDPEEWDMTILVTDIKRIEINYD